MPTEIALAIAKRNKETVETVGALRLANDADSELQEIREVLDALSVRYADGNHNALCWCRKPHWDSTKPHEETCKRAQVLYQRLRVDGGKGE